MQVDVFTGTCSLVQNLIGKYSYEYTGYQCSRKADVYSKLTSALHVHVQYLIIYRVDVLPVATSVNHITNVDNSGIQRQFTIRARRRAQRLGHVIVVQTWQIPTSV